MYLLPSQIGALSNVLLNFEVAYRSSVSDIFLKKYPEEKDFKTKLGDLNDFFTNSFKDGVNPAYLNKMKNKINNYNSDAKIKSVYEILFHCKDATTRKDNDTNKDVFFVSQVIDIILLFYDPLFKPLGSLFGETDNYEEHLRNFANLRNSTSHRASSKVNIYQAQQAIDFIMQNLRIIDDSFFWYVSKHDIQQSCKTFLMDLEQNGEIIHNLSKVSKKHRKLIERDSELKQLKERILGSDNIRRTSSSILIQGTGGVGKTALVLEFCYDVIDLCMQDNIYKYNFLLWLSAKEEELGYSNTSGNLEVNTIHPQFSSLQDIYHAISKLFNIDFKNETDIIDLFEEKRGIIVLDNMETINILERGKISDFINRCPENIQFIITTRPNDVGSVNSSFGIPINLYGFDKENGKKFIKRFCEDNFYYHEFDISLMETFIKESCGNPLIMVLSLQRIIDGLTDMDETVRNLKSYGSNEVEKIADFMYKNMMDDIITNINYDLKNENISVEKLLVFMFLYDEPIDLYTLRDLTEIDTKNLEYVLIKLITKYIISKQNGLYKLDELAIKFILIRKLLPDSIALNAMRLKIIKYKKEIEQKLIRLKTAPQNLQIIIEDWKPLGYPEMIAIAQAFDAYDVYKRKLSPTLSINDFRRTLDEVNKEFELYKSRGNHPYIKFQLARVLKLFLKYKNSLGKELTIEVIVSIEKAYSESYSEILSTHSYIMKTKSYPALLMQYGAYLLDNGKAMDAIKFLEECTNIYDKHFDVYDEAPNRMNSHYYFAQAAAVCGKINKEFSKEYLLSCRESIKTGVSIFFKLEPRTVNDYYNKKKVFTLLELYCIIVLNEPIEKKFLINRYKHTNGMTIPPSIRQHNINRFVYDSIFNNNT